MSSTEIAFVTYLGPEERLEFFDCYYRGKPPGQPSLCIPCADGFRRTVKEVFTHAPGSTLPPLRRQPAPNGFYSRQVVGPRGYSAPRPEVFDTFNVDAHSTAAVLYAFSQ